MSKRTSRYISNPKLPIIKEDWKGNPINFKGRFLNHEFPSLPRFKDIFEWKVKGKNDTKGKYEDNFRLNVRDCSKFFSTNENAIVWLGHASFLIRIDQKILIIDPILSSPSLLMKRYSKLPCSPELLNSIDYILISHNHRDHLDKKSLKFLCHKNPNAKILTGLRLGEKIKNWVSNTIEEAGWFQSYSITKNLNISYLPSRHWSKRWLNDNNSSLWGSFMIEGSTKKVFFGGDSGYGNHFLEIKETLGSPDFALLGIGAYKPEWFMHPSHTSPKDAYKAAQDLESKNFIPMHYGTFDLSDESIGDPIRSLRSFVASNPSATRLLDIDPGQISRF